jgi:site-specific DNA-methyltransferase (adenine-specific)
MIELNTESACSKTLLPLVVGGLTITCEDNMQLMSRYPDNYFDLAIVDPPYGIDYAKRKQKNKNSKIKYTPKTWDINRPTLKYFNELKRVSKQQIIWGGNYFLDILGNSKGMICWDKCQPEGLDQAMCEFAWTSIDKTAKIVKTSIQQIQFTRTHPTEKPTKLYKWLLKMYATDGMKILDTHLGSGSIAIACHDYKFELTACELDPEYFDKAKKRIINHVAQQSLF